MQGQRSEVGSTGEGVSGYGKIFETCSLEP